MSKLIHSQICELTSGFSVETTPGSAKKILNYSEYLAPQTKVYVTLLPGSHLNETLDVCKRLSSEGMIPVPHLAARQIKNKQELETGLNLLSSETNSTQVLAIAGGSLNPVGDFDNSMQLLETGLFDKYGIRTIGFAGHPEGSPDIPDNEVHSALEWKNKFAQRTDADVYIITQFCFDAKGVIDWCNQITNLGIHLPVHVGVPGIATLGTLLKHAMQCGIGPSINVLKKQAGSARKLLQLSAPEKLLVDLARYQSSTKDSRIDNLHVYPFGGLSKSSMWFQKIKEGNFIVDDEKSSIKLVD